jgi:hypothetical protein
LPRLPHRGQQKVAVLPDAAGSTKAPDKLVADLKASKDHADAVKARRTTTSSSSRPDRLQRGSSHSGAGEAILFILVAAPHRGAAETCPAAY